MYQSVASEGVALIAAALQVPLYQFPIRGTAKCQNLYYTTNGSVEDEVEDLYNALATVKKKLPHLASVSSGAILSDYQRTRVENVASRLGLCSLAFLWQRDTNTLLETMVAAQLDAIVVKIASYGLSPKQHLGGHLASLAPVFAKLSQRPYLLNACGEGGEYETFTMDCPLFFKRIHCNSPPSVKFDSDDPFAQVAHLQLRDLSLEEKSDPTRTTATSLLAMEHYDPITGAIISPFCLPEKQLLYLDENVMAEIHQDWPVEYNRPQICVDGNNFARQDGFGQFHSISDGSIHITPSCVGVCQLTDDRDDSNQSIKEATEQCLNQMVTMLTNEKLTVNHVVHCLVSINQPLSDSLYSAFNEAYQSVFGLPWQTHKSLDPSETVKTSLGRLFPPTRTVISVECILEQKANGSYQMHTSSSSVAMSLICLLCPSGEKNRAPLLGGCKGLHVKSISHWAPANIGPYSQTLTVPCPVNCQLEDKEEEVVETSRTFFSGQIGLIPETLTLPGPMGLSRVDGNDVENKALEAQCWLVIRHCHRLLKITSPSIWSSLSCAVCYGVSMDSLRLARRVFHQAICSHIPSATNEVEGANSLGDSSNDTPHCWCTTRVIWVQCDTLPKAAAVEWQLITCHTGNNPTLVAQKQQQPIVYRPCEEVSALNNASLIFMPHAYSTGLASLPAKCPLVSIGGLLDRPDCVGGIFI